MNQLPNTITESWSVEDVKSLDDSLTDTQCREALQLVDHNFDANIGINWDVIQLAIDTIKGVI